MEGDSEPVAAAFRDCDSAAGGSAATVSRILNGTGQFAPATRRAVEEAVRELGYRPKRSARALATRSTRATIYDVARRVGVSAQTMSPALSGTIRTVRAA